MRGEILDALLGRPLLVGAVEGFQRIGYVLGQPLQQFDELVGERAFLGGHEQQHADDARWLKSGSAAPAFALLCSTFGYGHCTALFAGARIVRDARLAGSIGRAGQAASLGKIDAGRVAARLDDVDVRSGRPDQAEVILIRGSARRIVVDVNWAPFTAASQTIWYSSSRVFARMIASLVR